MAPIKIVIGFILIMSILIPWMIWEKQHEDYVKDHCASWHTEKYFVKVWVYVDVCDQMK